MTTNTFRPSMVVFTVTREPAGNVAETIATSFIGRDTAVNARPGVQALYGWAVPQAVAALTNWLDSNTDRSQVLMSSRTAGAKLPRNAVVVGITDPAGCWHPVSGEHTTVPAALTALGCACGLAADVPTCVVPHEATPSGEPTQPAGFRLELDARTATIGERAAQHVAANPDGVALIIGRVVQHAEFVSVRTDTGVVVIKSRH